MNARMRFLAVGFWLLAVGLLFAQNSRFELFLRSTSNTAVTGASVYIVHMTTGDSLLLTEVSGKNGYYRRDDVTFGNYKIYVNGSLSTTQKFHPTDRIYLTLTGIDADGDYLIDSGSFEAGSIEIADLSAATKAYVATGGSFTSDSLRDMVGDSVSALSVDNVTTAIVSGEIVQKVFADTAALTATTGLEAGGRFIVRQLSSTNTGGGGVLMKIPKGYSIAPDNLVAFTNADGDTLIREEFYRERVIYAEWAGAKGDDSSDNLAAFDLAYSRARALDAKSLKFGTGTYRFSDSLLCLTSGNQVAMPAIEGNGYSNTVLKWTTDVSGIVISDDSGTPHMPVIRDLKIIGVGSGSETKAGILADTTTQGVIERVWVEGFREGIKTYQSNNLSVRNCYITENVFGYWGEQSPNETVLLNNYLVFNDSIQYYQNSGNRNKIIGGSITGEATTDGDMALYVTNGGKLELDNVSFENHLEQLAYVGTNARVTFNEGQWGYKEGSQFALVNGGTLLMHGMRVTGSFDSGDTLITQTGTSARVYSDQNSTRLLTHWTNYSLLYFPTAYETIVSSGSVAKDATTRGNEYMRLYQASTYSDNPTVVLRKKDGTYLEMPYTTGDDWLRSLNFSSQPVWNPGINLAFRTGNANVTMSGGDSTVFTCIVDTNGWTQLYGHTAQVQIENTALSDSVYDWNIVDLDTDNAAGTGTITWIVHHPFYSGTGTFKFSFFAIIEPRKWTR